MSDNMNRCGLCDHFEKEEGMFGNCLVKQSEKRDSETFSLDLGCEYFTPRSKEKDQPISFMKPAPSQNQHMATMFGAPSLLQMLFSGGGLPFAIGTPGCNSCSDEEGEKETKGWQNPVIRRKPGRKVVPWEEVKQRMLNKKQIGNTNL